MPTRHELSTRSVTTAAKEQVKHTMGQPMKIAQFLKPEDVISDLAAANKPQLLTVLSRIAAGRLKLDADAISSALMQREALGSTGIGDGTALPHATITGMTAPFALFARLQRPVDFESVDDVPVTLVCLLLMPPERNAEHLSALAAIARRLSSKDCRTQLRNAKSADALYAILAQEAP
ncbi:PTS sugar transporter subunit IIA [Chelatococcus asaccharovorans]|uniref:Phosphotransferase IIA-like nitrogen-regulatory protein PtsN n=1 Tax=Chelatococcus asaccharovorans TaxID=28210 RepID=A0A2V3TWX6_9HYPH|nr:PTS sugar transporter subunit IIA [Chelatococcus asaccharovorans]MBS7707523.1 PTS sugar transporter subunit IIA [Chelatococcus asaccharovorans]PXW54157.1 phosphotransferase IIA-like nitrogen-regulatory protein PtsN [Chelatococcus asaccharovorans]